MSGAQPVGEADEFLLALRRRADDDQDALRQKSELLVYGRDDEIRSRHFYGRGPRSAKR